MKTIIDKYKDKEDEEVEDEEEYDSEVEEECVDEDFTIPLEEEEQSDDKC